MNGTPFPAPLRVLVVDDCPDTTITFYLLLRLWGHEVLVAHDGDTAVAAARAYRPQVVLLDVALRSRWDGYDVAHRLRALPGLEQVTLICLTGYATEGARLRAQEAGFDHHLAKPPDLGDLQQLLAAAQVSVSMREPALAKSNASMVALYQFRFAQQLLGGGA
jgi:CheY-like chemotaxis protein